MFESAAVYCTCNLFCTHKHWLIWICYCWDLLLQDFMACTTSTQSLLGLWSSLQTQGNTVFFPVRFPGWTQLAKGDTVLVCPTWQTLPLCIYLLHNTEALLWLNMYSFLHELSNVMILIIIRDDDSYVKYLKNCFTAPSWIERLFRDSRLGMKEWGKDSQPVYWCWVPACGTQFFWDLIVDNTLYSQRQLLPMLTAVAGTSESMITGHVKSSV